MSKNGLDYEVIIGCEIHCQLGTKTKAFCSCENRYGGMPNTRVCPVCLGLPGAMPSVGQEYIEFGIRSGVALGCGVNSFSKFDRKHYFYPDLVKGYQVTQFDNPICKDGKVEINIAPHGEKAVFKNIRIERVHLEEDVGKSLHIEGGHSYIDYNRSGVPLIEIVSYPDMSTPEEAARYMQTVREILRFVGVSDANMEEGAFRCDANINLKINDNGKQFITPISEIKNMNSFKAVRDACTYEIKRQLEEYNSPDRKAFARGYKNTMGWDDQSGKTVVQRTKTVMIDYRFMPEPDVKPLRLSDGFIAQVSDTVGELPADKRRRFKKDFNLSDFDVETLTSERALAEWFEEAAKNASDPKKTANWILAEVLAVLNEKNIGLSDLPFGATHITELVNSIDLGKITGKQAKTVFAEMLKSGDNPESIIKKFGFEQISDIGFIEGIVDIVFAENESAVEDWKNGKTNVAGWLMGQVMKKSQGKANPAEATKLVNQKLKALC